MTNAYRLSVTQRPRPCKALPGILRWRAMDKILVVDDERDIRYAFHRMFDSDTLQVVDAASGEEVVEAVAKQRPDLVIMDITMGRTSGLDALRKLRELDPKL